MNRGLLRTLLITAFTTSGVACTSPITDIKNRVQETRDTEAYSKYDNDVARSNIEREKAGQSPIPILSRDEWAKQEAMKKESASKK